MNCYRSQKSRERFSRRFCLRIGKTKERTNNAFVSSCSRPREIIFFRDEKIDFLFFLLSCMHMHTRRQTFLEHHAVSYALCARRSMCSYEGTQLVTQTFDIDQLRDVRVTLASGGGLNSQSSSRTSLSLALNWKIAAANRGRDILHFAHAAERQTRPGGKIGRSHQPATIYLRTGFDPGQSS